MEEEIDLTVSADEPVKQTKKVKEVPPYYEDSDEDAGGFIQDLDYNELHFLLFQYNLLLNILHRSD